MTTTRIYLITAALIAGALIVLVALENVWATFVGDALFGPPQGDSGLGAREVWALIEEALHYVAFGLGVFLALRFFAPIRADSTWQQTIARSVIASVGGAIVALVFAFATNFLDASTVSPFPLGYKLDLGLDGTNLQYLLKDSVLGALQPLLGWSVLSVLGCILMRIWLGSHQSAETPSEQVPAAP